MTTREISNSDNIVDSRDIIARIEELQDMKDDFQVDNELPDSDLSNMSDEQADKWLEWDESDEGEELTALKALANECEGYGDWQYGASLIRDSYMDESWAREEMESLGYITKDLPSLIENNINWEGIRDDLQVDYMSVEWDGVTYWMRS